MPGGHPLADLDNVIQAPHAHFYSEGSIVELKRKVATSIRRALEGKIPATVANREVLNRPPWKETR